ncbi:MAG: hypothetical protein ACREEW_07645, partial [Caulobacteraceae bacterium]
MSILDAKRHRTLEGGASFPLSQRLYRLAWAVVWTLLAAWTPPPLHAWRRLLLRAFGAKIGPGAAIYGSARVWSPANLVMEARACLGPRSNCYSMAPVRLRAHAIVSQGAHLCAGG